MDIVSKNGTLLLNIGPRPDGTIPEQAEKILLELGQWLSINGEAIYGTRPWAVYGEGPTKVVGGSFKDTAGHPFTSQDIRFTKGDVLYAIALAWPPDAKLSIKSFGSGAANVKSDIKTVELVGSTAALNGSAAKTACMWSCRPKNLVIVHSR